MKKKKVAHFILEQINQIYKGGLFVLLRKLCAIPLILLAVPAIFLVRILQPFVLIRFGRFGNRIGGIMVAELYLCERDLGIRDRQTLDIFYYVS